VLTPQASPGFLLWRVTLRWQRAIAAALAPLGLTHVQFVLLATTWWLNQSGTQPNQLTVATEAATDVKMTSQALRALESKGLIVRETDQADTRAKLLRATPAGADLASRAIEVVEKADRAFFGAAGDGDQLLAILRPLAGDARPSRTRRSRSVQPVVAAR
jgi:DNA-binding MarR family transcriptional regulator